MEYRTCTGCGTTYPATKEYFYKSKSCIGGLSTHCKYCCMEYQKQYKATHREAMTNYAKLRRTKNREKVLEAKKRYRETHKEEIRDYLASYRENNRERLTAYRRELRRSDPVETAAANHVCRIRRQSRETTLPSTLTKAQWEDTVHYFEDTCAYCGEKTKLQKDHFIPLTKGGGYTKRNIVPACAHCNASKSNKPFTVWYHGKPFYDERREERILEFVGGIA